VCEPFIWAVYYHTAPATNPNSLDQRDLYLFVAKKAALFLFDFAPDGVFHAVSVAKNAVRSYRTFSPLL
jgi:hypothetical protein